MSTSKHIDKICIATIVISLVFTLLFMNGLSLGLTSSEISPGYGTRLFDTDTVHTIDILMDNWDSFIETCENEEYSVCTALIDGEKYSNIGIRAKGNTSLSNVKSLNSQRYSFKLEFDHYETGKTYYGLDKLCLNNLIQDNTMMKDYLVYRLMDDFGADAPLCSYVYITINGEDWGLYLAVEGVEDSFLQRNYGADSGELYKPDSSGFGGGRGNGKEFRMEDFQGLSNENSDDETPGMPQGGFGWMPGENSDGETPEMPQGGFGRMPGENSDGETPEMPQDMPQGGFGRMPGENSDGETPEMPQGGFGRMPGENSDGETPEMPQGGFGGMPGEGGFGGMGSDDVKLKYIDENADSYSNIFNQAKTDVTLADQQRLISSLKDLNEYTNLEAVLDMDEVLRYFVVHNFVVNGDSYTGSMIHNYYLHEKDGQLSMIPWDYNLAFGTFMGGNASSSVNASIDSPVTGGSVDDRPMVGWIFSNEEYIQSYHQLFSEFLEQWIDSGRLTSLIESTAAMLRPYVEKDPTKFCTTEEFETAVPALSTFVSLRGTAVSRQLSGDSTPVETGNLNISSMGSMGSMGRQRKDIQ